MSSATPPHFPATDKCHFLQEIAFKCTDEGWNGWETGPDDYWTKAPSQPSAKKRQLTLAAALAKETVL